MSNQDVKQAVASWVAAANIPHLNQITVDPPKRFNFEQNSYAGEMTRAAAFPFIRHAEESRIAVGGASDGWKRLDYDVVFQVYCHSLQNYSQDAMADFDAIIDAIKAKLRAGGHRLGKSDGDVIWQAAEPGISVDYGEPKTNDGGATEIWAGINFRVTQMIRS